MTQSPKNPCSVAALLRGNFGSLVDFAEMFTKIHDVLLQSSLRYCIAVSIFNTGLVQYPVVE